MKRLIVNADDFGFTSGVNAGIIGAHRNGIVTSTTIMACGEAFEDAARLAATEPRLSVGVHLVCVGASPVALPGEIASLAGPDGLLPASVTELAMKVMSGGIKPQDVEREFNAQVERVRRAGIIPSHLDTHKHSHTQPGIMRAMFRVAADHGIGRVRNPFESFSAGGISGKAAADRPVPHWKQRLTGTAVRLHEAEFRRLAREHGLKTPDLFYGVALTGLLDAPALRRIIGSLGAKQDGAIGELMCHPALYDEELESARTRLKRERQREYEALVDESARQAIRDSGIELIGYRDL
jgi:predicted glycoside hydrolase/deacetylase ChbG (UPF0249 family)